MKSQRINRWIVVGGALAAIGIAGVQSSRAQGQPARRSYQVQAADPAAQPPGAFVEGRRVHSYGVLTLANGQLSSSDIRKAAEAVRDAEGDDAKEKAEAHLRRLLSKRFEADMEQRQAALEEMVQRLEKLKEQFSERKEKMDDIVDLQIKVLVNEADGLGFMSNAPSTWEVPLGMPTLNVDSAQNNPFAIPTPTTIVQPADATYSPATAAPTAPAADSTPATPQEEEEERLGIAAAGPHGSFPFRAASTAR